MRVRPRDARPLLARVGAGCRGTDPEVGAQLHHPVEEDRPRLGGLTCAAAPRSPPRAVSTSAAGATTRGVDARGGTAPFSSYFLKAVWIFFVFTFFFPLLAACPRHTRTHARPMMSAGPAARRRQK